MKMNFLQRNNIKPRRKKFLPLLIVVFLIALFYFPGVRNFVFETVSPVWKVKDSVSSFFVNSFDLLKSKSSLTEENLELKLKIAEDEKNRILYEAVRKENEDLKEIFNRKKNSQNMILGAILEKPFLSPYDTLIVDAGLLEGVSPQDKVLAWGDVHIGYVNEVFDHVSKVVLYSSDGEKVNVLIGKDNILKEAVGIGGGNFKAEVPAGLEVNAGDTVTIPSISTNVFGTVERVDFKETDSFKTIFFKGLVNVAELKWVEILTNQKII